eukprot:gene11249-7817_t
MSVELPLRWLAPTGLAGPQVFNLSGATRERRDCCLHLHSGVRLRWYSAEIAAALLLNRSPNPRRAVSPSAPPQMAPSLGIVLRRQRRLWTLDPEMTHSYLTPLVAVTRAPKNADVADGETEKNIEKASASEASKYAPGKVLSNKMTSKRQIQKAEKDKYPSSTLSYGICTVFTNMKDLFLCVKQSKMQEEDNIVLLTASRRFWAEDQLPGRRLEALAPAGQRNPQGNDLRFCQEGKGGIRNFMEGDGHA